MKNHKYRMPAEWERHAATWLAWPYGDESFVGCIPEVERVYLQIILSLSQHETVRLIVRPIQKKEIEQRLADAKIDLGTIDFVEADYTDVWARDWGPTFVRTESKLAFVKWTYNAYGSKFASLLKDDAIIDQSAYLERFERLNANLVLEGGAIETNGAGMVLTTEESLLDPHRNPGMSKKVLEEKIGSLIGADTFLWLKRGLINDHTDGHIDEIARFVAPDTVVYAWEEDGPNHDILADNLSVLRAARDGDGNPLKLIALPIPSMTFATGEPAPTSYCNFYIANNVVLVPQFGHENDTPALRIIKSLFPNREIIGVDSYHLLFGGGSKDQGGGGIHCITQQEPQF